MEPGNSLPCLQEPAIGTYPEPDASSPHLHSLYLHDHFNVILPYSHASDENIFIFDVYEEGKIISI
jgi:hypothetical protein